MKNWFKKITEKKGKNQQEDSEKERQENISSLYEIVEDHLKSLDYEQLKDIGEDFAERFRAHQQIISQIVRTPPPRMERRDGPEGQPGIPEELEIIDARLRTPADSRYTTAVRTYPDEMILSHYDRMIRTQYDRLIDLTVKFLKEILTAEIDRVESQTKRVDSEVGRLSDALREEAEGLREELVGLEERQLSLIKSLEASLIEQNRRITLLTNRLWMLLGAVGIIAIIGGAAFVLSLIR